MSTVGSWMVGKRQNHGVMGIDKTNKAINYSSKMPVVKLKIGDEKS